MTEFATNRDVNEFPILGDYDPGQFIFDYFNEMQMKDLAQSLGVDLIQSREIRRDRASSGNWKLSVRIVEAGGGDQRSAGEVAAHLGALPTATLIEVLVRLREQVRLYTGSDLSADQTLGAWMAAMRNRSWMLEEAVWEVEEGPLSVTLLTTLNHTGPSPGATVIKVQIPGERNEFTPSGRLRLTSGRHIGATVFAQPEQWDEDRRELIAIAHAVFARMGDPRFRWRGASFGDNSDSGY
jgi:hypothetical protein